MNKFLKLGPYLYATAIGAFGVIQLVTHNFLTGLLPVAATLPLRWLWMDLSSAVMLLAAAGILFKIRPQLAAVAAGVLFTLFFFALQVPDLLMDVHQPNHWSAMFENVMLGGGAFVVATVLPSQAPFHAKWNRMIGVLGLAGYYGYAISLFIFAIQHIMYFDYIVTFIPSWMPGRVVLSCLVIGGYVFGGIAFILGRKIGLTAILLGSMFLFWVFVLHAPRAFGQWNVEPEWTSLFVAMGVSGVAFCIACREVGGRGDAAGAGGAGGAAGAGGAVAVIPVRRN
jgi:hypothetical protein